MEKECFKCNIIKQLSEFYVHKQMADGHLNKCKECTKLDTFGRTEEEIEKRKHRDRNRSNHEDRIQKNRDRLLSNPDAMKKYNEQKNKWAKNNKHKRNAHLKVARSILKGTIIRKYSCEKCSSDLLVEAHHEDYLKPLEIVWLCSKCHHLRHKELREKERQK
jgi:hypothetical protein